MSFISTYNVKLLVRFLVSIGVGIIYAISDELHQSFIPGRSPSAIDVGIDTAGVIIGILVVLIIIAVYNTNNKYTHIGNKEKIKT